MDGVLVFSILTDWKDASKLSVFKSSTARTMSGIDLAERKVTFVSQNAGKQYGKLIENQLEANNGSYLVDICISNEEFSISPFAPADPPPTLGETILQKLYSDTTQSDVTFIFDTPEGQLLNQTGDFAEECPEEAAKSTTKEAIRGSTLQAHRLILSQWPYFKTMFEGGFAESGPGEKRIHIKDTKMKAFNLLIRFMSTGRLDQDFMPKIKYSDELEDEEDVSMEDMFLAADRYDVMDLREIALKPLLASLGAGNALPFLFRTASKFLELRKPAIKFVAKSAGSAIPRKEIRNAYRDHPDLLEIVMDLLDVFDGLHP